ncbi:uncharacterized mitochondrial protein AtMg00820-like [Macadamia integrifolia]|uniref:uncharacterized mitochondrial protein AtMg00820-like n=1 Tax=Macadamia integrifolia TaxID=60698 RepID=UPI001C4E353F|nr:uncharacterized mitochondrial protein AtMg00820-like [Macadamia integrifolia]
MIEIESQDIKFIEIDFSSIGDVSRDLDLFEIEDEESVSPILGDGGELTHLVITKESETDCQPSGSVPTSGSDEDEPASLREVLSSPAKDKWQAAMEDELSSISKNQVWKLVNLPLGHKTIGNKWVLKVKHKEDGSIDKYKARLMAKGYTQKEGVDYDETFSPAVRIALIRLILAIVVKLNLELF